MLRVLFFGRLREELDCAALELPFEPTVASLDALQQQLRARQNGAWSDVLDGPNIIRAVNQEVVDGNAELAAGDEVAFFPPVTGG